MFLTVYKGSASVLEIIKPQFLKVTKFAEPNDRTKDFFPFLTLFKNKQTKTAKTIEKILSSLLICVYEDERLIPEYSGYENVSPIATC